MIRRTLPPLCALFRVVAANIFFRRAVAQKRVAVGQNLFPGFLVELRPLRLVERPFVPIHAQPLQRVNNS